MPRSNPFPESDAGSAAVEFLTLGIVLLVPLVYLVLVLASLQGAAFAAEGAARQAARQVVLADSDSAGRAAVAGAVGTALADWRIPESASAVELTCAPDPGNCLVARGSVRVTVRVAVALPLLPRALDLGAPGAVPVEAHAVQRVSMFEAAR
jgi:Flp pilus assembly protein TadG